MLQLDCVHTNVPARATEEERVRIREERERKERETEESETGETYKRENKVCSSLQSEFMFHVLFLVLFLPRAGLLQEKKASLFPSVTMEGLHLPWKKFWA